MMASLYRKRTGIVLSLIAVAGMLMPSLAHAQFSGSTVDGCDTETVDWSNDVEITVCVSGNASGLYVDAEADGGDYSEYQTVLATGAQLQIYDGSALTYDSGFNGNQEVSAYVTPNLNDVYTLYGWAYELYDPSQSGDYGDAYWTEVGGDSITAQITAPATTLSLATSGTPSTYGSLVTFTATISSGPTGSITFYDGGTTIGAGTINGTTATYTTSALALGAHTITAGWTGNATYPATTSNAITQTVNPVQVWDSGTVTLNVYNSSNQSVFSETTNYGQGSTPSSVAEGLAGSNSNFKVTSINDAMYIEAAAGGANTDSYYYTVTAQSTPGFSPPSFQGSPASASLAGGANASSTESLVYAYCIGTSNAYCTSPSPGYDSVGNVLNYSDSVMGTWSMANGYDALNRLTIAQNTATTSTSLQYAGQNLCWAYDAFGNRTAQSQQTSACPAQESSLTPTASYNTNNQVTWTTVNAAVNGFGYDAAGDVTNDNVNQYLYDAEGRVCAEASTPVPGFTAMTGYMYDAEGDRVAKGTITSWSCDPNVNGLSTAANETDYILGPGGEQVTELAQDANGSMNWQRTYAYAGSALIATYDPSPDTPNQPLPSFRLTDWLGTMRATTDSAGVAQGTCTGLPFGDGVTCQGNIPDPRHFTGKERDAESGNDYFGARYYASTMGRFMSPDWAAKVEPVPYAKLDNPQSLNLYEYVLNNPLHGVDPDGHCSAPTVQGGHVGICLESYIQTARFGFGNLGHGDNRGPVGNDPRATFRTQTMIDVNVKAQSATEHSTAGVSVTDIRPEPGVVHDWISDAQKGTDGSTTFTVHVFGENGEEAVGNPLAPGGWIEMVFTLRVAADGTVSVVSADTKDFPSVSVYSYQSDGTMKSEYQQTESGNVNDLNKPKKHRTPHAGFCSAEFKSCD